MTEITAVTEFGQYPERHPRWIDKVFDSELNADIMRFEETDRAGQMSRIPWIVAHHRDGSTTEFNATLLASIERAPDAETAEGDEA